MGATGLSVLAEGSEQRAKAMGTLSGPGIQPFGGTRAQQEDPSGRSGGVRLVGKELGHEATVGREQAGIDGARLLKRLSIDGDVDQGIEPTHGANVARFGPFNAQVFGLAVDAFAAGARGIDGLVERPIAIEQSAHQAPFLPVGVFDAALAFGKLLMGTGLSSAGGKEQRTAKALGAIAVGMCEYGMIVTIESSLRLVQATFSALTMPASFPFVKTFQYRSLVRN